MFGEEPCGFTSLIPKICREIEQENTFRLSSKTLEGNFRNISWASLKFMARQYSQAFFFPKSLYVDLE